MQVLLKATAHLRDVMAASKAQPHDPETDALAAEPVTAGLGLYKAIDAALLEDRGAVAKNNLTSQR